MVSTLPLPPNKTYPCRHVTVIQAFPGHPTAVGVIEVRESKTPTGKPKCSRYAVRRDDAPSDNERCFKLTKPGGAEWYFVLIGAPPQCECHSFLKSGTCKHIQAMHALIREKIA